MVLGLQGSIGSVLIEEIVAAEKGQIALDVLDEAELEGLPGQGGGLRAEIRNGQGDLRPAGDSFPGPVPAASDLFVKIVGLDRELHVGGVGDEGCDACLGHGPRIDAGGRAVFQEPREPQAQAPIGELVIERAPGGAQSDATATQPLLAGDMPNRSLEIGDVVLEGLAAYPQLSVVQAGDSIAQSPEPGWQLGQISPEELRDPPKAATQGIPRRLWQRRIMLNHGMNIGQGRLEGPDVALAPSEKEGYCLALGTSELGPAWTRMD